jgi:2-oxoglutarate ferredoxin oxidoreductase subunit gamma
MAERYEVRFSGSGGQGIILAGIILAEAVSIIEGRNAVQSQSYGPESRGGASKSEVVISDEEIDYPKVVKADALLCFTQEAARKYIKDVKDGGMVIIDEDLVPDVPEGNYRLYKFPFLRIARNELGRDIFLNIIALSTFVGLTNIVKRESIEKAILARIPKGTEDMNRKAMEIGFRLAEEALNKK